MIKIEKDSEIIFNFYFRLFDIFGYSRHGGKIVGNERLEIREGFFDVVDECRAARACQEAFLCQLLGLRICDHVRAESGFDNRVEAKLLESLYDLTELRVCKLT